MSRKIKKKVKSSKIEQDTISNKVEKAPWEDTVQGIRALTEEEFGSHVARMFEVYLKENFVMKELLKTRVQCRKYLETVSPDQLNAKDCLEKLGYGPDGLFVPDVVKFLSEDTDIPRIIRWHQSERPTEEISSVLEYIFPLSQGEDYERSRLHYYRKVLEMEGTVQMNEFIWEYSEVVRGQLLVSIWS